MTRPTGWRRVLRWTARLLFAGLLANGMRLRRRLEAIARVEPVPPRRGEDQDTTGDWTFVTTVGVDLDDEVKRAVVAHAERHELDVVDLLPADLPVERALESLRMIDPATFRTNRLAPGRGFYQALAVSPAVAARAELAWTTNLDPYEMVRVTTTLKQFAPASMDVAVVTGVHASPDDPDRRKSFLRGLYGGAAPAAPATQVIELGLLGGGLLADRLSGGAALLAYSAQPFLVFAGARNGARPRDLARHAAARVLEVPASIVRAGRSDWRSPAEVDLHEELRPVYADLMAAGTERFFEDRRETCPWCGSAALHERIRVPDYLQHKPGTFVMDECDDCGVVFQNPRLTLEGLDFYYRDFYDGLGEEQLAFIFGSSDRPYIGRAEMLKPHLPDPQSPPKRWLDVGTGHAHFCLLAKEAWPDTTFDGLDMSESVEIAERRGWVDHAYRGLFPEIARDLTGTYDVVSMHHYLEHVREPFEELDAATSVLVDGGHLIIELPDPESRWGRLLGGRWLPWFQPQHQHMIPIANLKDALADRGFTVLSEDRGEADQPVDLVAATWFALDSWAPDPRLPWGPPFTWGPRAKRIAMLSFGTPVLAAALLADVVQGAALKGSGGGNTYRVLARKGCDETR